MISEQTDLHSTQESGKRSVIVMGRGLDSFGKEEEDGEEYEEKETIY